MQHPSDLHWLALIQNSLSNKLPNNVVLDVLQRLPVQSILRFKCFSKLWCSLFSHPNFVRIHLNSAVSGNAYILLRHVVLEEEDSSSDSDSMHPPEDQEVEREIFSLRSKENCEELGTLQVPIPSSTSYYSHIGCFNGLIYINESNILGTYNTLNMSFWNPAIREVRSLPRYFIRNRRLSDSFQVVALGFGHEPITNDYKVVRFIYFIHRKTYEVVTYSLRRDSWKRISAENMYDCYFHHHLPQATTNGALHWLVYWGLYYNKDSEFIIAFHIDQEKLSKIPLPTVDPEDQVSHICRRVSVFEDQLTLFTHSPLEEEQTFHVWVMKEYGNEKSWTYLFSVHQEELMIPIHFVDDSLVIMKRRDDGEMVLGDSSFEQTRELNVSSWSRVTSYVESLVSPRVRRRE